ncbi:MAG: aldo/keto reductase [Flavobacteriales bacterium]|nr:aldo/keto reductase [Flavobacteriales bacterium]
MFSRKLGNTDIKISTLGLGCWQFSKNNGYAGKFWSSLSDTKTQEIVKISLKGGINWFDTAELYGNGKSEKSLSNSLKELKVDLNSVFIATKWWPLFRRASSIKSTIDDRLNCLGGYPISLHQVHMPLGFSSIEKEMNFMADLVEAGKIKYIGVSNFNESQMIRAYNALDQRGIKLASNQVEYSILNRKVESNGILNRAKELGVSIIAYSPLSKGLVSGKFHDNPKLIKSSIRWRRYLRMKTQFSKANLLKSSVVINELKRISKNYNATPSQVALNWLVNLHGDTVFAIPGSTKPEQAIDNINSMTISLSSKEIEQLDIVSKKYL